jgi:ADP-ribose pyrophosphatase YjhB (NUDIX family)
MPKIRSDIVDVYIFRRGDGEAASHEPPVELLQLCRSSESENHGSESLASIPPWHPVMGHVREGETALACALREMAEEVGLLAEDAALFGMWSLEQVHPFFVPQWDAIVMSPRFAAEVSREWRPILSAEHTRFRWVHAHQAGRYFTWPGQLAAVREITTELLRPGSPLVEALRVVRGAHSARG